MENAIFNAAETGDIEAIRTALENGANVNTSDEHDRSVLLKAAKHGHYEVVNYLIEQKADVNSRDNRGTTALYWAV